ncbi:hypothetical protein [Sabulicella rubraurantiaca]|uniref:hypothetical protein n=1 Tax=Sabulicella rubraurantiaca TaxID=2811429 RepID=UPI001A971F74|nr:hypothetical protein [Sabulicella rubraurantiaca]
MMTHVWAEHDGSAWSERAAMDARLDDALADTFPASDPVAISVTQSRPRRDGEAENGHEGGSA